MLTALCNACRHGHHAGCSGRVAPPAGMLGGYECPCGGECEGKPQPCEREFMDTMQREVESALRGQSK